MAEPLSLTERADLLAAMDAPMTDEEALLLIAELVMLACELVKTARPEHQRALAPMLIRAGNLVDYIPKRFADAKNERKGS